MDAATKKIIENMDYFEERIFNTISEIDDMLGVPDYHSLRDKMLPVMTNAYTMTLDKMLLVMRGCSAKELYHGFERFLQAVECVVRYQHCTKYAAKEYDFDADLFKKAVGYVKGHASEKNIVLYLD